MPYINEKKRKSIDRGLADIAWRIETIGEFNYAITELILEWLDLKDNVGYTEYNEIIGVLESAKLEFYRRAVAAYEDEKIKENGDVY